MKLAAFIALLGLSLVTEESNRCVVNVDLEPLVSVNFQRGVTDEFPDRLPIRTAIQGNLLVSKGGAVTLLRTDTVCCDNAPSRTVVAGLLTRSQLTRLRRALHRVTDPPEEICKVDSHSELPAPEQTITGSSQISLYRSDSALAVQRFTIRHDSPSSGPVPGCDEAAAALETELIRLQNALRRVGARPLRCQS